MKMNFRNLLCLLALIGVGASASHAAKEHGETLSLDGTWQIIFDHDNQSRDRALFESENFLSHQDVRDIQVPSVWERIEKDYEGVAVYRKTFTLPRDWQNRIVHLSFDAVNYRAEVYVNDEVVGVHEGGFTPFSFRIDSMLEPGQENAVTLRVLGPILLDTDKVIDGMGAMETPQWRGGITGGIWQSVRLVASGKNYINDIFIEGDIHKKNAKVTLDITNFDEFNRHENLSVTVREQSGKTVALKIVEINLHPGKNSWTGTIGISDAKLWSPDSPNLYRVEVSLSDDGKPSHTIVDRFGLREFTVKDNKFQLNDKDIYVKAVFLEGVYPVGIATPVDLELARKEIRLAKEAGFNMIRPWRRPPPPQWLDLADEMGVMVVGSPALECMDLPVTTPDLPRRVLDEISMTIKRDRNRASVVIWELFNELRRPVLKQMMVETAMMARDLDPSRLILDESGGYAHGAKVYLPYKREFEWFNDVHTYPGPGVTNAWYDKFLAIAWSKAERDAMGVTASPIGKHVKDNATSFVSELGYGSFVEFGKVNERFEREGNPLAPPTRYHAKLENQLVTLLDRELADVYASPNEFYREQQHIHGLANARMIEAARANPRVTGYCVHALTGGDWVMGAGLLDLWRDPKKAVYDMTKAANAPRILTIRSWPRNAYKGQMVRTTVVGINDLNAVEGTLVLEAISHDGSVAWSKSLPANLNERVSALLDETFSSEEMEGNYRLVAKLTDHSGDLIATNTQELEVFAPTHVPVGGKIAIVDDTGAITRVLRQKGVAFDAFNENTSTDTTVFVALRAIASEEQVQFKDALGSFAESGGTVVYLQFPFVKPRIWGGVLTLGQSINLPLDATIKPSTGLWGGMTHVVPRNHPVFAGLPTGRAMYGLYENVRPAFSVIDMEGENLVKLVANDNFPDMTLSKRHYIGSGDVWMGSDLIKTSHGKGTIWLNTMRLVPNLGKDPVADIILLNLLSHLTSE